MTDRKRRVRSEGIFQHCSLVTAPRGNVKANGWYFGFIIFFLKLGAGRGGSGGLSCVQECEASASEKTNVSLAWHIANKQTKPLHFGS